MAKDTFLHGQYTALERKAYYYFPIYYFLYFRVSPSPDGIQIFRQKWIALGFWFLNFYEGPLRSYFVIANFPAINVKHIGEHLFHISSKALFSTLQCHFKNHKNISKSVFRICDILVRIRILGSVHLINGSMRIRDVQKHTDPKDPDHWYTYRR
jgi:hypothetical protein